MLGFHSISSAPVSALRSLATGAVAGGNTVYAQSTPSTGRDKRNVAKYGSASWVDLSGAATPSDAPVYAQSLARQIVRATTGNVWVNPDTTVFVSSDLSPYAQGNASFTKLRIKSTVWVDLDAVIAASSDLSPYAQTIVPRETIRETIRGTRRSTSRAWTNGDDFFPPQDDLAVYGQSRYSQSRLVYRPKYQGTVWVDLVDAVVVVPPSGTGAGGRNYVYLSPNKPQRPVIARTPFQAIKPTQVKAPDAVALTEMRQELYALGKQLSLQQAQVQRQLLTKTEEAIDPDMGLLMQQMMVEYRLALYNDQAARLLILLLNDR